MLVYTSAVEPEACRPDPYQKGATVHSLQLCLFSSHLPNLTSPLRPRVPISSLSNPAHRTPSTSPSPPTSPACKCTSQGSSEEPETSGEQADSVFQELPKSCGVLSGTPTGDLQSWHSHIHTLAHEDSGPGTYSIHPEHKYTPEVQTAKGVYTVTYKHTQLWMCTCARAHTHTSCLIGSKGTQNWLGATHDTIFTPHPQLFVSEREKQGHHVNQTSPD